MRPLPEAEILRPVIAEFGAQLRVRPLEPDLVLDLDLVLWERDPVRPVPDLLLANNVEILRSPAYFPLYDSDLEPDFRRISLDADCLEPVRDIVLAKRCWLRFIPSCL